MQSLIFNEPLFHNIMHNQAQLLGSNGYVNLYLIFFQQHSAKMSLDYGKMRSHFKKLKRLREDRLEFKNFLAYSHFYLIHLLMRDDWLFFDMEPSKGCSFISLQDEKMIHP